jgi:citrate lyase beta subunit
MVVAWRWQRGYHVPQDASNTLRTAHIKKARAWAGQKNTKGVMNWRFTCTRGESRTLCIHPGQLTCILNAYIIDFIDN